MFCSAYELYLANITRSSSKAKMSTKRIDAEARTRKLSEQFKKTLSHEGVIVHFVGAWYVTI